MEELKRITERTAERHRILTLCSSAANQRRIYDKSLIQNLESCTAWINQHKDDVLEAYVLATRNTQLGSVTNAYVRSFFLPMVLKPVVHDPHTLLCEDYLTQFEFCSKSIPYLF